jgi:arabinose-5-phosphate isomerase
MFIASSNGYPVSMIPGSLASSQQLLAEARAILRAEAGAMEQVADRLDESIVEAIKLIHARTGPALPGLLAVSGIGKSGLVAQRISASFASTGTASHFLHPVEAVHGDVGRVRRQDIALLLSYSGETEEVIRLVDVLKRMSVPMLAITRSRTSTVGKLADVCVELGPLEEACPLKLAPTTSTNCISAVGDALVLGVMSLRSFTREDFAAFHPAGALGRKLIRVEQAMSFRVGENFLPLPDTLTVREALTRDTTLQTQRRAGAIVLVDGAGRLSGILTNADLKRKILSDPALLEKPIAGVMTRNPKRMTADALASEALALLRRFMISDVPVVNERSEPIGMIDVQDLVTLRTVS